MKYEEQLKIEQLGKQNFERITSTVPQEEFVNFYKTHTKQKTKEFYNINNDKTLKRILNFFNYDWSYHKSQKGKPTGRTHESYVAGGQKSAETQKQNWNSKTEDEKVAWCNKQKSAHSTEEFKSKIKQININYYANISDEQKEELRQKKQSSNKKTWDEHRTEILDKAYSTRSNNSSWNTSSPEEKFYSYLLTKFTKDDIIRQYKDPERYPYCCDFYIRSKDLFIELNLSWTHGGHKFDANNEIDKIKLNSWEEKAKQSDFYKNAIETWTKRDLDKFEAARKNNLNYKVYYTEEELYGED